MLNRLFSRADSNKQFWDWFSKNSSKFYSFEQNMNTLFHKLKDELDRVDPNLVFEFSPMLHSGKREFVISADGIKSSFDSVETLVHNAPKFQLWDIVAFRQPKSTTGIFCYEGIRIRFDDIYFQSVCDNNKLGLRIYMKDYNESSTWTNLTFLLLDYVLGEYDTEIYVGWIEKHPYMAQEGLIPVSELQETMRRHKTMLSN